MSEDAEQVKAKSLLEATEARSRQAETFAWAVPALALAAQAFLLNRAFDESTPTGGRVIAALAAMVTLVAALHLLGKHTFNFEMYEAVIERERMNLGLPRVSRGALLGTNEGEEVIRERVGSLPKDTGFRDRDWMALELKEELWHRQTWVLLRKALVVDLPATKVWAWVLGGLALLDLGVLIYLLAEPVRSLAERCNWWV